jgi:hypothetical protein
LNPLKWFEMGFKWFQAIQAIQDEILHWLFVTPSSYLGTRSFTCTYIPRLSVYRAEHFRLPDSPRHLPLSRYLACMSPFHFASTYLPTPDDCLTLRSPLLSEKEAATICFLLLSHCCLVIVYI